MDLGEFGLGLLPDGGDVLFQRGEHMLKLGHGAAVVRQDGLAVLLGREAFRHNVCAARGAVDTVGIEEKIEKDGHGQLLVSRLRLYPHNAVKTCGHLRELTLGVLSLIEYQLPNMLLVEMGIRSLFYTGSGNLPDRFVYWRAIYPLKAITASLPTKGFVFSADGFLIDPL